MNDDLSDRFDNVARACGVGHPWIADGRTSIDDASGDGLIADEFRRRRVHRSIRK